MGVAEAMTRGLVVVGVAGVFIASGCGSTKTVTQTVTTVRTVTSKAIPTTTGSQPSAAVPCRAADVHAAFAVIPGSAGAGQIGYALVLTNVSSAACTLAALPNVLLLDRNDGALPTQVSAADSGGTSAPPVVMHPGAGARAQARFSPDVPGPGEQQPGRCEPVASYLQISLADGTSVNAPITPPTSVCSHGSLSFSVFGSVR